MITKLNKFVQSLKSSKKYTKNFLYSQIIRNERTKRKLTLAEMAKGICSVSYLCKFEKNEIIADEAYIRAIFERLNIDFNLVGKNLLFDGIENALKAYLAYDYETIEMLFNSIDDSIFNAQNELIKCFYYLIKKLYVEFQESIKTIDNIKDSLLINDVGVFFFLVVQYYIDTHQYYEALSVLNETEYIHYEIEELEWLILEQKFNVSFFLGLYPKMYANYELLNKINNIAYPSIRRVFTRAKFLYSISECDFRRAYTEFQQLNFKNIPENYHLDIKFYKIASFINGQIYLKAFDEIYDNKLYLDPRFLCLLLISAYYINDDYYIDLASKHASEYEPDPDYPYENKFIKFMHIYFTSKHKHEYVDYIKDKVIPNRTKYIHHIYTPFYMMLYAEYLRKCSRYKEACNLLTEKIKQQIIIE